MEEASNISKKTQLGQQPVELELRGAAKGGAFLLSL